MTFLNFLRVIALRSFLQFSEETILYANVVPRSLSVPGNPYDLGRSGYEIMYMQIVHIDKIVSLLLKD